MENECAEKHPTASFLRRRHRGIVVLCLSFGLLGWQLAVPEMSFAANVYLQRGEGGNA